MQLYLTSSGFDWWCAFAGQTDCGQKSSPRLPPGLLRPAHHAPCPTAGLLLEYPAWTLPAAASWANPSHHLRSTPHNRLHHLLLSELKSTNLSLKQLDSVKKGGCYSGLQFYVKKINQIPFDAVNNVTL